MVTLQRPDLVLIDRESKTIELYELTSCADKAENIRKARERKIIRYSALVGDVSALGWKVNLTPFQVCALGDIDGDSRKLFTKLSARTLLERCARNSLRLRLLRLTAFSIVGATQSGTIRV